MWVIVMFDLPVGTPNERKRATAFRNDLLDLGFGMSQFSIYTRHCADKEQAETQIRAIEAAMPPAGKVHILQITDRQYANIRTFRGKKREPSQGNPDQLALF